MKQEEKNQQSKNRILSAAIEAFGEKGYDGVSLNTLLADNGISKGLAYHYFDNKDQLYLACSKLCFEALIEALSTVQAGEDAQTVLQSYFEIRNRFFMAHPQMGRLFFDALLQPPVHLEAKLANVRAHFECFNRTLFLSVLKGLRLREDVSEPDALHYLELMQNALHLQYRSASKHCPTETGYYEAHAQKALKLLLYGLIGGNQA